MSSAIINNADVPRTRTAPVRGRDATRLSTLAYATLALGLVFYVVTLWAEVYIDTHKMRQVAPDAFHESHRHWRLRTALVVLIWSVLGGLTLPFFIGWFVLIPTYLWYVYRVLKGFLWFELGRPIGVAGSRPRP